MAIGIANALFLAGAARLSAEEAFRTFTNTSGATIDARLEKVEGATVSIVRQDGQKFSLPLSSLSEADQAYVQEWAASQGSSAAPGAGPAPVTSGVPLETVNEIIGAPLFVDGNLWQNKATDVADRLKWPRESETPYSSSFRLYATAEDSFVGARPNSLALYGEDGAAAGISVVYANKGDFFGAGGRGEDHFVKGKPVPGGIEGLRAVMQRDVEAISEAFTKVLGEPSRQKFGEGETRTDVQRWDWNGHAFLLGAMEDEYVSLAIQSVEFADKRGRVARVSDAEIRTRSRGNIEKRDNGDVIIQHIPMVDQGPKGYCAPATAERCMRYLGIQSDMYLLAMAGQTGLGGGTSLTTLFEAVGRDIKRKGRSFDEWHGELNMREIKRYIDDGIPVMWTLYSGEDFNKIANERTKERKTLTDWAGWKSRMGQAAANPALDADRSAGHVVILIGYNEDTGEIAFSDSWGEDYKERWITLGEAQVVSQGSFYVVDL